MLRDFLFHYCPFTKHRTLNGVKVLVLYTEVLAMSLYFVKSPLHEIQNTQQNTRVSLQFLRFVELPLLFYTISEVLFKFLLWGSVLLSRPSTRTRTLHTTRCWCKLYSGSGSCDLRGGLLECLSQKVPLLFHSLCLISPVVAS